MTRGALMRTVLALPLMAGAAACVTIEPKGEFSAFPARFEATQTVTVRHSGRLGADGKPIPMDLLAQVSRDGESLTMTFADPLWQTPILRVAWFEGSHDVKWLVDGVALPFAPEEIVDGAREVYRWTGLLESDRTASFTTLRFNVKIADVAGQGTCQMPRRLELRSRVPDGPAIDIATKDWNCAPDVSK